MTEKTTEQLQKTFMEYKKNILEEINIQQKDFMQSEYPDEENFEDVTFDIDVYGETEGAIYDAGFIEAMNAIERILFSN